MSHKYRIYEGGILIGESDLEYDDSHMFVRWGRLIPADGYSGLEPLFREFTLLSLEHMTSHQGSQVRLTIEPRMEELREIWRKLDLRVWEPSLGFFESAEIEIEDFGDELDDVPEVTVRFFDGDIYRRYFDPTGELDQ
jgi:hypothetical protein